MTHQTYKLQDNLWYTYVSSQKSFLCIFIMEHSVLQNMKHTFTTNYFLPKFSKKIILTAFFILSNFAWSLCHSHKSFLMCSCTRVFKERNFVWKGYVTIKIITITTNPIEYKPQLALSKTCFQIQGDLFLSSCLINSLFSW